MSRTNITLNNNSPLIDYQPPAGWGEGDGTGDPFAVRYSRNGTVNFTSLPGASASMSFHGTGIWIFGAKRSNHGRYNVTLDDSVSEADGFASNPELFQTVLFSATNLKHEKHTITIRNDPTNDNAPFLDIDFITFETETTDSSSLSVKVENTASSFAFSPESAWKPLSFEEENSVQTARLTSVQEASMTLAFTGNAIALYGIVGPSSGLYSVQVDGQPSTNATFNATSKVYTTDSLLFHANDLGPGNHTLRMINKPEFPEQEMFVTHAMVGTSFATYTSSLVSGPKAGVTLIIIVAVVSGFIFLVFAGLVLHFGKKQRRQWK
ncbi:hypothetical protein CCMSSC00406_0003971 [Pleurotus cornucopiae]|uniref:Uncharacterized protein n=1 Tax=Pleurotus cornucopiae TaxID=5321 RepID=A0ACB7IS32_PLECO|nr:hypothetical protein CCMSSC00406_0003971 [Pleurotus cornucopiae]